MSGLLGDDESNGNPSEVPTSFYVKRDDSDETTENKPPPNLSDMPNEVVSLIIERSDYKEQLILRRVSKSMRSLVDKSKPACVFLHIVCDANYIRCTYNGKTVVYAENENTKSINDYHLETAVKVLRDDYEEVALDDLKRTLNNPKLQLDDFFYGHSYPYESIGNFDKRMETILKSLNHQVQVKKFDINFSNDSIILTILPYLKPGFLETIHLITAEDDSDTTLMQKIRQLSSLDQWKQAQELQLSDNNPMNIMEYATHFKRFDMYCDHIFVDGLISLRDHFSRMDNFEYCSISVYYYCFFGFLLLEAIGGVLAPPNEKTEYVSHYPIPDSDGYFELLFFEDGRITFEKKKNKQI